MFVIESRDGLGRTKQEPESRAYMDVLAARLRGIYPSRSDSEEVRPDIGREAGLGHGVNLKESLPGIQPFLHPWKQNLWRYMTMHNVLFFSAKSKE